MDNVILNIYDLLPPDRQQLQNSSSSSSQPQLPPPPPSSVSNLFGGFLAPIGLGAYHTSIDVRGFRYQFGSLSGISRTSTPEGGGDSADSIRFLPPNCTYRESIILGQTWCDQKEINATIQRMRDHKFKGENYHIAQRNCNHFSETFATALILGNDMVEQHQNQPTLDKFPAWVNRLARVGSSIAGMDDGNACNVVEEARVVAGVNGKLGWNLTPNSESTFAAASANHGKSQKKSLSEKQKALLAKLKKSKA
ncbi:hypothetical protein ACHAWU_005953 [Discostella pseudostelligera]|uniref:PPPDE domain-containing protein n=1 Tax=Discostella pseudostelligera TaxID=259834 RepID=A0ABD3MBW6_9STRA